MRNLNDQDIQFLDSLSIQVLPYNFRGTEILYKKENYVIFKGSSSDYIVYNYKKPWKKGHTHVNSKDRARQLIDKSIAEVFPLHWSNYFIESMIRLTTNQDFADSLYDLRHRRKAKWKGRGRGYYNKQCV